MGTNPTKAADNIYCRCRKEAAKYNDRLHSREGAAELLGYSPSSLAGWELGTDRPSPEAVMLMSDLYHAPELRNYYCRNECPLGGDTPELSICELDRITVKAMAYTIIAVHNHPTSSVPSLSDLLSARDKKYKYGIIAGHDGTIYKYAVPGALNEPMADGGLDLLERVKYISDEEERSTLLERALGTLKESGVEMEVL